MKQTCRTDSEIGLSPGARIRKLAQSIGEVEVARWCAALLEGAVALDDSSKPSLAWLGGRHAAALERAPESKEWDYWPRVWAARGLMYAWSDDACGAVIRGLGDPEWRVREMSAKVGRAREVADCETALVALAGDPVPRVRAAALLALGHLGEVEHGEVVKRHAADADPAVRRAAARALDELGRRLDRDF